MPLYVVLVSQKQLCKDVVAWLRTTYGTASVRPANDLIELQSHFILCGAVDAVITDLPPGTILHAHYDALISRTSPSTRIIIINDATSDIFVPSGNRSFRLVAEARLYPALATALAS